MTAKTAATPVDVSQPKAWGQAYLTCAMRQLELLRELDRMSKGQRELIEAEDPEPLLAHLAARQEIINQLDGLHEQSRELRAAFDAHARSLPNEMQLSIRSTLDGVAATAQAVMRRDAADQDKLQRRRKELSAELAELASNQRANRAYVQGGEQQGGTGIMQDHQA
ncbi:MAG TPA: hypothetical protein VK157_12295 [Phycisphaerales bacterium]|nr:hypothetical protein [Phycisphaerales bacterium]